jgi:catechol 2,3-dioxygenase-like lactoylglutathione lyase family enzyme
VFAPLGESISQYHHRKGRVNLAKSIEFYGDTLGMKLQQQFPGFAFFSAGGVTLVLGEPLLAQLRKLARRNKNGVIVGTTPVSDPQVVTRVDRPRELE